MANPLVDAVVAAFRAEGMTGLPEDIERFARAAVEVLGDDGLCPHGWPHEYCGVCHEDEARAEDDLGAEERIETLIRERDHAVAIVESFQRLLPEPDASEVETVARAWWAHDPGAFDRLTGAFRDLQLTRAKAAIAALYAHRSPQDENHEAWAGREAERLRELMAWPQGEDHKER